MRLAPGLDVPLPAARLANADPKCAHKRPSVSTLLVNTKKKWRPRAERAHALPQFRPELSGKDAPQVTPPRVQASRLELRNSLAEDNRRRTRARAVFLALGARGLDTLLVPRTAEAV